MTDQKVYHLGLSLSDLAGARIALIPGDPERVPRIAEHLDEARPVAHHREFNTYVGKVKGQPVVVASTGVGGSSTSICVEELAQLGITTFIRVGTTGTIREEIQLGDLIVTHAAVRLDGASDHFAPLAFPAVADFEVTRALVDAAKDLKMPCHVGVTVSSATFYQGQERYDTVSKFVPRHLQGSLDEWRALGAINYEMESGTLFTMGGPLRLKTGCIGGVIVNRTESEALDHEIIRDIETKTIRASIEAVKKLL